MKQLNHSANCLAAGKLTVAYLGGSIAQAGTIGGKPSWREGTTRWLRETYPDAEVTEIDASLSGTGSDFGAARFSRDVLKVGTPDLLFVEFAVNDIGTDPDVRLRAMEGIVRQARTASPAMDIVFVYTTMQGCEGKPVPTLEQHHPVAVHYSIQEVDVGSEIWAKIAAGEGDWYTYVLDFGHPNGEGHELYWKKVTAFLKGALVPGDENAEPLPEPISPDHLEKAYLKELGRMYADAEGIDFYARGIRPFIRLRKPGDSLEVPFEGKLIFVFWHVNRKTGTLLYSIDNGAWQEAPTQDHFARMFPEHIAGRMLADGLPEGAHILKLALKDDETENDGLYLYAIYGG